MTEPLTDEEIQNLREWLPHMKAAKEEAEYRAAVRLVFRTWRGLVVGLVGIISAFLVLRENARGVVEWLIK